jgi:tyrosinase
MLAFLEINIQRVLGKPDFGIPYWDWSFEGSTPPALQSLSLMFTDPNAFGSDGNPVTSGRFAFNAADPNSFRVLIETDLSGSLRQVVRGLRRQFRSGASTLPSVLDVNAAFDTVADPNLAVYDQAPWDRTSTGFRNRLEGFIGTGLHNQVHRWVGGDMEPPSSPNDPLFYVHHCNVDRIWEGWMQRNGRVYLPDMNESPNLLGHRIDDPIVSPFLTTPSTPRSTLDVSNIYVYDVLP